MKKIYLILIILGIIPLVNATMVYNQTFENNFDSFTTSSGANMACARNSSTATNSAWYYLIAGDTTDSCYTNITLTSVNATININDYWTKGTAAGWAFQLGAGGATASYKMYIGNNYYVMCTAGAFKAYNGAAYESSGVACSNNTHYNFTILAHNNSFDLKINGLSVINNTGSSTGTARNVTYISFGAGAAGSAALIDGVCVCTGNWNTTCCNAEGAAPESNNTITFNGNTTTEAVYYNETQKNIYGSTSVNDFDTTNTTISLYNAAGLYASSTASSNYSYNFTNLPAGNYTLNATASNGTNTINTTTSKKYTIYGLNINISNPSTGANINKYINLTIGGSINPSGATITKYNLTILNNDLSYNATIAGNITRNYTITNTTEINTSETTYQDILNLSINRYIINKSSAEVKSSSASWNVTTRIKYYYQDETTAYSEEHTNKSTTYTQTPYNNPYPNKKVLNYTLQMKTNNGAFVASTQNTLITTTDIINLTENPAGNITGIIDIHSLNLSIGSYYLKIEMTDNNSHTINITKNFNLIRDITLNTQAHLIFDNSTISSFNQNLTDLNNGSTETSSSNAENYTEFYLIKGHNYTSVISVTNYSYDIHNLSTNTSSSSYINYLAYLYTNNSISIYIYYSNNLSLITGATITIKVTGTNVTTFTTSNGTQYIDGLTDGNYSIKFTAAGYGIKYYNIEVGNSSHQNLYAYLVSSAYSTIFTTQSALTGLAIEGASFTAELLNGSNYILIESLTSDLSGKVQMYYLNGEKYRFTISATGYSTKLFYLNPIIFSAYNINLDQTSNTQSPQDYADISIVYYPKTFNNNQTQTFTFLISSPLGRLINYSFNLDYPTGKSNGSNGISATGESFNVGVNITGANRRDRVNLTYNYTTSLGGTKNFWYSFEILNTGEGNNTIANLKNKDYGLGAFEKMLLVMIILCVVCGFAFLLTGMAGSIFIGLVIMGISVYLGFLPIWSILISLVLGAAIILKNSTGGNG